MIRMSALYLLIRFIILCIECHCALQLRVNNLCINSPPRAPALIKPTYKSVKKKNSYISCELFFPSLCDTSHLSESVFLYTNLFSKKSAKKKKTFSPLSLSVCLSLRGFCRRNMCLDDFSNFFSVTRSLRCCVAWQLHRATRQLYRIQVLFSVFVFV